MTVWTLQATSAPQQDIDSSPIQMRRFSRLSLAEIERISLGVQTIGDLFRVTSKQGRHEMDRIVLQGDLRRFHHVAAEHHDGQMLVEGSVGDHLAGPSGSNHLGMRGGLVEVRGDAGCYTGHRMRRGTLVVHGSVGTLVASQMIAGTVVIGGTVGSHAAYGMKRGTLVAAAPLALAPERFSAAYRDQSPFWNLFSRSILASIAPNLAASQLLRQLESAGVLTRRGDGAVAGQGEIAVPSHPEDRFPAVPKSATLAN